MAAIDNRPAQVTVFHYDGDDFSKQISFEDADGVAIDVSAWAFVGTLDPLSGASVALTVAHGATGTITVSALDSALTSFTVGAHWWDLKRGDTNRTLLVGPFIVVTDRAVPA